MSGDGCVWYFVNLSVDVCAGIFICYLLHQGIDSLANKMGIDVLRSGEYWDRGQEAKDENVRISIWFAQLIVWLFIVVSSKVLLFFVQLTFHEIFLKIGQFVLADFAGNPQLELIFVMVIVPMTLNSVQYWMQDQFLKGKPSSHPKEIDIEDMIREADRRIAE